MKTWIESVMWHNGAPNRTWGAIAGCLLFLSPCLAWSDATLEILSPASGHQWQAGTTVSIQWNQGNAGKFLRMELHKSGKRYRMIRSRVRNTGSYRWRVPKSVQAGRYTVTIQSLHYRQVFAASDEFEIRHRTALREQPDENRPQVNAPAHGEILGQNRYLIEWDDVTDALGTHIGIQVYRGERQIAVLDDNAKNSGRYLWAAPARQLPEGRDFRIRLQSKVDKDRFILSESFTVGRPSSVQSGAYRLQVTLPSGKQRWGKGQTYVIRWLDSKRKAGSAVQIDLDRAGKYYQTIVRQAPNTGRFKFTVPHQVVNSNQYQVRVTSTTNPQISGMSAKDFSISGRSAGRLRVISPTSGKENWQTGQSQIIKWEKGAAGKSVRIDLYQSGRLYKILDHSTDNDGLYQFKLAGTVAAGPDYAIRVQSTDPGKARVYDMSDRPFAISNAQVPVVSGVCSTRCCRSLTPARHCGPAASLTQQANTVTDKAGVAVSQSTQRSSRKPTVFTTLRSVLTELPAESQAAPKYLLAGIFEFAKAMHHSKDVSRLINRRTRDYLGRAIRSAERSRLVARLTLEHDGPDEAELRGLSKLLNKLQKAKARRGRETEDLVRALLLVSRDQTMNQRSTNRRVYRSSYRRWLYLARAVDRSIREGEHKLSQVISQAVPTSNQRPDPFTRDLTHFVSRLLLVETVMMNASPTETAVLAIAAAECPDVNQECLEKAKDILLASNLVQEELVSFQWLTAGNPPPEDFKPTGFSAFDQWAKAQPSESSAVEKAVWVARSEYHFKNEFGFFKNPLNEQDYWDRIGLVPPSLATQAGKGQVRTPAASCGELSYAGNSGSPFGNCGLPGKSSGQPPGVVDPSPEVVSIDDVFSNPLLAGPMETEFHTVPVWDMPGACFGLDPKYMFGGASDPISKSVGEAYGWISYGIALWTNAPGGNAQEKEEFQVWLLGQFANAIHTGAVAGVTAGTPLAGWAALAAALPGLIYLGADTAGFIEYQVEAEPFGGKVVITVQDGTKFTGFGDDYESALSQAESKALKYVINGSKMPGLDGSGGGDLAAFCGQSLANGLAGCLFRDADSDGREEDGIGGGKSLICAETAGPTGMFGPGPKILPPICGCLANGSVCTFPVVKSPDESADKICVGGGGSGTGSPFGFNCEDCWAMQSTMTAAGIWPGPQNPCTDADKSCNSGMDSSVGRMEFCANFPSELDNAVFASMCGAIGPTPEAVEKILQEQGFQ